MPSIRTRLIALLVLLSTVVSAQEKHYFRPDSLRIFFPTSYGNKVWRPVVALDAFRSYYSGSPIIFRGLRGGMEFSGTHRFGIGVYILKKDVVFSDIKVNSPYATDTSQVKYKMSFMSLFYERVFFKNRRWEVSFPLYVGVGRRHGYVEDYQGNYPQYMEATFSILNAGIGAKFFIFPWLAPRIGGGFRYTIVGETSFRKAFTGPYYAFGVSVVLGELYRSTLKKQKERD